jgi:hypothetical protein
MTTDQLIETLTFPLLVSIESEKKSSLIQDRGEFPTEYLRYTVVQIAINKEQKILEIQLMPSPSLELLGYSFESGV